MTPLRRFALAALSVFLALPLLAAPAQAAQTFTAILTVIETSVPQSPYWNDDGGEITVTTVATCYADDDGNKASTFTVALYKRSTSRGGWVIDHLANRYVPCGTATVNFGTYDWHGDHFVKLRSRNGNGLSGVKVTMHVS